MAPRWLVGALAVPALLAGAAAQGPLTTSIEVAVYQGSVENLAVPFVVNYAYPPWPGPGLTTVHIAARAGDEGQLQVSASPATWSVDPTFGRGGNARLEGVLYLVWSPGDVRPQPVHVEVVAEENPPLAASTDATNFTAWPPTPREPPRSFFSDGGPTSPSLLPELVGGVTLAVLSALVLRRLLR